ncbi:uncharacterized protein LOC127242042 [Andrographis paniculata]|uniref:uncharacterized protein LOC127242042 n=1 Tax=Andrographis paniculata TaxID=175694 RepID=UPI0021E89981|nr:uncharacterized protein LOC127242042 [Andrographis paniculata]
MTITIEDRHRRRRRRRPEDVNFPTPRPSRICFSYAAYAKNLIHHLRATDIPVAAGLSESEFAAAEAAYGFTFPPDLRAILREGLPVAPGFPNWRSSSRQQLEILTALPVRGICMEVSRNRFWTGIWGDRPECDERAVRLAEDRLRIAPPLVPIYRSFYIPATPRAAGNPVFYVRGGDVRLWSFDVGRFFQRSEFGISGGGGEEVLRRPAPSLNWLSSPAWAATEARRIEFWTEVAERGGNKAAREETRGWWDGELGGCLEEVCWRLREGGWREEEVREMVMMDGCDERDGGCDGPLDEGHVARRMTVLSERLLSAGWSREDVVDSLGCPHDGLLNKESDGRC